MKNITTALLCLLFSTYSFGQILNEPASWPNASWTITGTYNAGGLLSNPTTDGSNLTWDDDGAGSASDDDIQVISPVIDLTAAYNGGETWITVSGEYVYNELGGDILLIETYDADAMSWSALQTFTENSTSTLDYEICASTEAYSTPILDISGFTPTQLSGFQYRISYDDVDGWMWGWCLTSPTITSAAPPTCLVPSDLSAASVTSSSAVINWTANNGEIQWEYSLQPAGTGLPSGSGTTTSDNPLTLNGLTANTSYEIYIRAVCDGGDVSDWVGPLNFTTQCDEISAIPYFEGFNSDSATQNCWIVLNENGDLDQWNMDYTFNSFEGDEAAAMYTDFNSGDNDDWLISPGLVLTGNERLKFHQRVQSSFEPNDFEVLLSTTGIDPTAFTNVLLPLAEYDNTEYIEYIIDLSAYSGTVNIAFHVPGGGLDGWRLYIDNFIVEPIPTCPQPTDLDATMLSSTEAVLSWIGNDSAQSYEVVVQAPGSGFPTVAGNVTDDTSLNYTGLTPDTNYEFYVRTFCGTADGYSSWAGPFLFYSGYCPSVPTSNDGQGISQIVLGGTTFTSAGDVTYEDFTTPIVDVSQSVTAELFITFATGWTYNTNVWIDFNNDLVYDNDTELFYQGESLVNNPTTLDASFVIPGDVPLGVYNMRIGTADSGQLNPDPCYNGSWGVTIDMTINVIEAPSCVPPSGLTAENITGTSADLSWTGDDTNVSWEYVLQLNGEPAPTGSGTAIATTSFQATDLDYLTTYDLYVMALCGDTFGNSNWIGPFSFTTTQQIYYDVECEIGSAPIVIDYCYTDNDSTFWVFTSDNGFPLELTFNAGTMSTFGDNILVYDGVDNTGTLLFDLSANDSGGDLSGVVVESSSDSIYVQVVSSAFTSCQTSSFLEEINFEVICKTCITQSVDFEVLGSCEPDQEFLIEATVTDMGDALGIELSDGLGATQTVSSTGVVTFGPYNANDEITISTVNVDDPSCALDSGLLTFLCPPPPNECSIVYAGEDTTYCSDGTVGTTLSATYHIVGQDSNSYDINSQENCPTPNLTGGTPTSLNIDDQWSDAIDIGFEFCFFGTTYNQILIGSNGVLSFEFDNAGGYNGWGLGAGDLLPNSTNGTIYNANIFGVGHDIDPSAGGDINYMILGSFPERQFVVNYSNVSHFSTACVDENGERLTSTTQIILYESSNYIDINIIDKPVCDSWNGGLAVVGVQNIDDTIAFTPENRNTSVWETTNESWRFSPSQGDADYILEWYDGDNNVVGTEDTITVYPEAPTTYVAAVTYNLCNGDVATAFDEVFVEATPTPIPVPVESEIMVCGGDEVTLEVNVDPSQLVPDADAIVYYWTYNNVDVQEGPNNSYTFDAGTDTFGDYTVTAYNQVTGCYSDAVISVNSYMNENCIDIPQGISPNGDGYNDCLVLDHLEDREDIVKAEVYNRYGVKVFELNDYVDHWCGQDGSDSSSGKLLPVGTYFYVIKFASDREPITSWIYLNY